MASFASSTTTGGARKHAWTNYTNDSEAEKDDETSPITDVTNFACDQCDFTSTSKKGINVHITARNILPR